MYAIIYIQQVQKIYGAIITADMSNDSSVFLPRRMLQMFNDGGKQLSQLKELSCVLQNQIVHLTTYNLKAQFTKLAEFENSRNLNTAPKFCIKSPRCINPLSLEASPILKIYFANIESFFNGGVSERFNKSKFFIHSFVSDMVIIWYSTSKKFYG